MNQKSVQEYIARQEERYGESSRKEKSRILDDVVAVTGYHRKSVLRQLSGRGRPARGGQVGRPVEYGSNVSEAAALVHEAAGGIGARRLHPFVGELSARLVTLGELDMAPATEALLNRASPATLERMLADVQVPARRKSRSLTKPGTLLRNRIEVRTFRDWDNSSPGFVEVDTVAHCGPTTEGFYLWTVTAVDVATGWVELDVVWGKTQERVGAALRKMHRMLPVPLLGIDSDNGSEFINKGLYAYCESNGDHLHQEQALPQERQRSRGAEERGCRPEGHGARTLLLLPSIQEVEGPLLPSQAPCQLLSAGPKAARQEPPGHPRRALPRRRHDSLPAHGRERTARGSAQSHP